MSQAAAAAEIDAKDKQIQRLSKKNKDMQSNLNDLQKKADQTKLFKTKCESAELERDEALAKLQSGEASVKALEDQNKLNHEALAAKVREASEATEALEEIRRLRESADLEAAHERLGRETEMAKVAKEREAEAEARARLESELSARSESLSVLQARFQALETDLSAKTSELDALREASAALENEKEAARVAAEAAEEAEKAAVEATNTAQAEAAARSAAEAEVVGPQILNINDPSCHFSSISDSP